MVLFCMILVKLEELSGPVATSYTVEGNLLGHISIASDEVVEAARELNIEGEEIMLLRHMILSHHGKLEYGSPKAAILKRKQKFYAISIISMLE